MALIVDGVNSEHINLESIAVKIRKINFVAIKNPPAF